MMSRGRAWAREMSLKGFETSAGISICSPGDEVNGSTRFGAHSRFLPQSWHNFRSSSELWLKIKSAQLGWSRERTVDSAAIICRWSMQKSLKRGKIRALGSWSHSNHIPRSREFNLGNVIASSVEILAAEKIFFKCTRGMCWAFKI